MSMPAADATSVAYSYMLDASGLPRGHANDVFEQALTELQAADSPPRELSDDEKRDVLRRQMQAGAT